MQKKTPTYSLLVSINTAMWLLFGAVLLWTSRSWGDVVGNATAYLKGVHDAGEPMPSDEQFEGWLKSRGANITLEDQDKAWGIWCQAQHPSISVSDLSTLITAERHSINTAHLKYILTTEVMPHDVSPLQTASAESTWWMSGEKLRLDTLSRDSQLVRRLSWDDDPFSLRTLHNLIDPPIERQAFDGNRAYELRTDGANGAGNIVEFHRPSFNEFWSPLSAEMLVDSKEDLGARLTSQDLILFLTGAIVEEQKESLVGISTVTAIYGTPATWKIWLNPDANYAVLQFAEYTISSTPEHPLFIRQLDNLRKATGLKDRGSGIFLPDEFTEELYSTHREAGFRNGELWKRSKVQLLEAQINQPIENRIFSDIFPAGMMVRDDRLSTTMPAH